VRREVFPLRGPQLDAEAPAEPAGVAGMIRVIVREDDPLDRLYGLEDALPQTPGRGIGDAAVDNRPAALVLEQPQVDVIELEGQRHAEPAHAGGDFERGAGLRGVPPGILKRGHQIKSNANPTMETERAEFSISDLAREFDVTPRAIRFYEDQGLLAPRRDGQRRIYTPRDRTRLKLTLRGKRLGLSLSEIRELIDMYEPGRDERPQLERFLAVLESHKASLVQQREDIEAQLAELQTFEKKVKKRLKES
jgi:DNA-binding transcriptional MerR regulator